VLVPLARSPKYDTKEVTDVPYLEAVAVHNEEAGEVTVFAVNRDLEKPLPFSVDLRGFGSCRVIEHLVLEHDDLKAVNDAQNPDRVKPHARGGAKADGSRLEAVLGKASWNVIRVKIEA